MSTDVPGDSATATPPGRVTVDAGACTSCGRCVQICPTNVFRMEPRHAARPAYPRDCCVCLLCVNDCPARCITVQLEVTNYNSIYDTLGIDIDVRPDTFP